MAMEVKLRDVEAQLSRVAQSVQLHVQIADSVRGGVSIDPEELSALVGRVEKAQNGLQTVTTTFLTLARQYLPPQIATIEVEDGDDTETEDEFEKERQEEQDIKVEKRELLTVESDNIDEEDIRLPEIDEDNCEVEKEPSRPKGSEQHESLHLCEPFSAYIWSANVAKRQARKNPNNVADIEYLITHLDGIRRSRLRATVKYDALDASYLFLDFLRRGNVTEEEAKNFVETTILMSTFVTSVQSDIRKHSLLMQFARFLTDINNVAIDTQLAEILAPLKKCRDDIVEYCCRKYPDGLKDVSNSESLIHIHQCMAASRMYPYVTSMLLKFVDSCVEYDIKVQAVKEAERTPQQWMRFRELGRTLSKWLDYACLAKLSYNGEDASEITETLKAFRERFPKWVPEELLENWARFICRDTEIELIRFEGDEISMEQEAKPKAKPTTKTFKSSPGNVTKSKALHEYLRNSAEAKSIKIVGGVPHDSNLTTLETWSAAVHNFFDKANEEFFLRLVRFEVDRELATDFAEATTLAVSVITTQNDSFQLAWIVQATVILDGISKFAVDSALASALVPIRDARNSLLRHCEKALPDCLYNMAALANQFERSKYKRLNNGIHKLARWFRCALTFCTLSHDLRDITSWTESGWKTLSVAGVALSKWIEHESYSSKSKRLKKLRGCFEEFNAHFPGRLPKALLISWNKFSAAQNTRIRGNREVTSESTVVGVKRPLPDPGGESPASKRVATKSNARGPFCSVQLAKLGNLIKQLQRDLDGGNVPLLSLAQSARAMLTKTIKVCQEFVLCVEVGDMDEATMNEVKEALEKMTELYCKNAWDYSGRSVTRRVLNHLSGIAGSPKPAKILVPIIPSIRSCQSKLQLYWNVHYSNMFKTIASFVQETEQHFTSLSTSQLEDHVQLLICQLCDAVDSSYAFVCSDSSSARSQEFQEKLKGILPVLNRWLDRVNKHFDMEKLSKLLRKLIKINLKLPGAVPETLLSKIEGLVQSELSEVSFRR